MSFSLNKNRHFIIYLFFLSLVQILSVFFSKPLASNAPHIFARYTILVTPVGLVCLACGLLILPKYLTSHYRWQYIFPVFILCSMLLTGPFPRTIFPSSSAVHIFLQTNMMFGNNFKNIIFSNNIKYTPKIYSKLSKYPVDNFAILEVPFHYNGYHLLFYQLIHNQKMFMGFTNGFCSSSRTGEVPYSSPNIHLKNFLYLRNLRLLNSKIDYVIFHKKLHHETTYQPDYKFFDISSCIQRFKKCFSKPIHEDPMIAIFSINDNALQDVL